MIRINLLPQTKKQARAGASGSGSGPGNAVWVGLYAAAALMSCVVLAIVYYNKDRELDEQLARNREIEALIASETSQTASIEEIRAALQQSQDLEAVVTELQHARFGPTRVLMELSRILSAGGGPTIDPQRLEEIRRTNPLAGYNRSWDTRRLWLTSFEEEDRGVEMHGVGKTNEDVAEFLRRLTLSESFADVHLEKTEAVEDPETDLQLIAFELTATVRY